MLVLLLGLGVLVVLGRRGGAVAAAPASPTGPVVSTPGAIPGAIPGARTPPSGNGAPSTPASPRTPGSVFAVAPGRPSPSGLLDLIAGRMPATTAPPAQEPPVQSPPSQPPASAPPVAAPGQPTIPGTTIPIPPSLPPSIGPWSLNQNGCDMGEGALGLTVQVALIATEGSSNVEQAVALERFAQQIAYCGKYMEYATRLGQRAAEIRARAGS